jgi:hypothetical protein
MADSGWPALDGAGFLETTSSLQLWAQIVGKLRLTLNPMLNHWWQVPLYVSARGLATSPIPVGHRVLDIELDFIDHRLVSRTSDGGIDSIPLGDGTPADFYAGLMASLRKLDVEIAINPVTVEMPEAVHLDSDGRACRYDALWARRFFEALVRIDGVFKRFRGGFQGKASPVHFFWGGFDLAVTRFSGRPAPPHPGGIPHVRDAVMREAYSHEVSSAGFWPGDARFPEAAFYSYAYPEPAGFREAAVRPAAARFDATLGEFVLPYAAVRAADDPEADLLAFLETTYAAAADLARWDRRALERPIPAAH